MKRISGTVLGIAVSEQGFFLAEVNGTTVAATAFWNQNPETGTPGLSKDQIASAATALRKFLKEHKFSANKAIIGLPAKWITARAWQVPPSAPTAANAILRLAAERQFPPELKDFVFDYAGTTSATEQSTVLLAGTSQERIGQIVDIAQAAGLNVLGVTSSALALSAVLPRDKKILVTLSNDSTELVMPSDTGPRALRHLAVAGEQLVSSNGTAAPALAMLGSELMRASLGGGESASGGLLLWDGLGLRAEALTTLRDRYNLKLSAARDLSSMQLQGGTSDFGPAAALALLPLRGTALPLDFLHTRLTPPRERRFGKKVYWGIAIGVAILIGIASYIWSIHQQQQDLDQLNQTLRKLEPAVKEAKATDARVSVADEWYATRPSMLNCLEHITQAFPQEGVIWASNISVRDNGMGTISGRARDQNQALAVYDRMKSDPLFSKVVVNDVRQGTGNSSRTWTFSISFTFNL